jgi:hypothetical protein
MLTQTLEEVSLKGLSQYFDNNLGTGLVDGYLDNPVKPDAGGIIGVWDNELKRAIFTKRVWDGNQDTGFTLSYAPMQQAWISEHSYLPNNYFERNNQFFAFKSDASGSDLYQHNRGKYGTYYGGVVSPMELTVVFNEAGGVEKVFDNAYIHSVAYSGNDFEHLETFKQIQVSNDYQDSQLINIETTNQFNPTLLSDTILGRWKKNHFQIAIPRDDQSLIDNIPDQWSYSSRAKSKYLEVRFIYFNGSLANTKLTVNFIEYMFRVTAR